MSSHTLLGYVGDHKTDRQHMLFCKIRYKQPQTTRPPAAPISSQLLILQSLFSPAMARYAYRRRLNNSPRRDAKYRKDKNVKYMHLGAGQVGVRQILQRCWSSHVVAATTSIFLVRYAVLIRQLLQYHQQPVNHALQQAISNLGGQAALYVHHVIQWQFMDSALYDIPLLEWLQAREFRPRLHLHIGNIPNDMPAMKMTQFNTHQLSYICFVKNILTKVKAGGRAPIFNCAIYLQGGRAARQ